MHYTFATQIVPGMASISHPSPSSPHSFRPYSDPALTYKSDVTISQSPNTEKRGEFATPIRAPHAQHQVQMQDSEDIMPRTPTPPSPTGTGCMSSDDISLSASASAALSPSCVSSSDTLSPCTPATPASASCTNSHPDPESLSLESLGHRFTELISYPLCQLVSESNEHNVNSLLLQFEECIQGFQTYSLAFPHLQKQTQTFVAQLSSKKKMVEDTLKAAGMYFPSNSDPAALSVTAPPQPATTSASSVATAIAQAFPTLKCSTHLLDDFRELRTLRSTLFGSLKLFEHRQNGRKYAVKMSSKSSIQSECLAENPLNELSFLRRINDVLQQEIQKKNGNLDILHGSNFICRLMAEYENSAYLISVLQFASGGDLFDYLDKQKGRNNNNSNGCKVGQSPLNIEEARYFFIQLLQGVAFLHRLNICHLDLSLENLLLDDSANNCCSSSSSSTSTPPPSSSTSTTTDYNGKRLFICDFGAARELSYSSEDPKTEIPFNALRNNRPGKLSTMSHEVFAGKDFHGSLADAYSCGVLFFMFLTSVPPYEFPNYGDKRFSLIFSGQLKRLIDAWKMNDRVPQEALEIISKLICPEEKRWTIEQVLKHPWIEEGMKQMQQQQQNQS